MTTSDLLARIKSSDLLFGVHFAANGERGDRVPIYIERALAVILVLVTAFLAWRGITANWRFTTDDAFITLRYARHLYEGHGVVWNLHDAQPVEGYSNFFFVVVGALAMALHADPIFVLKIGGVLGLAATLAGMGRVTRTYDGRIAAFFPGFVLLAYPGETYWAASGLETTVFQAFVLASLVALFDALDSKSPKTIALASIFMWLACLTRPDGLVVACFSGLALFSRVRGDRKVWTVVALAFVLPLAIYEIWRVVHFGAVLPHSVVCKRAYTGNPWALLRDYAKLAWPLAVLGFAKPRREYDARDLVLLGVPVAYAVLLYGADPIVGQNNRHALLAFALLSIAACANVTRFVHRLDDRVRPIFLDAALALAIACFACVEVADAAPDARWEARHYGERMQARAELANWLGARAKPADAIVVGDAGLVPYEVHAEFIDAYCLSCLAMTSDAIGFSPDRFATWMLAQKPRFIVVNSVTSDLRGVHMFYGVYPALVKNEAFRDRYILRATFGAAGNDFRYLVFELATEGATPS